MQDLFVPLPGLRTDDGLADIALTLSRAHRSFLSFRLPSPALMPVPASWGDAAASVLAGLAEQVELKVAANAAALRERLLTAGVEGEARVDASWLADAAHAMAQQARTKDMTLVIGAPHPDEFPTSHAVFCALLFESGRPVLAVPPTMRSSLQRIPKLLLAWKPTRECARACHDALVAFAPGAVEVLVVEAGHEATHGADIASHLARHGVDVEITHCATEGSVAETVLQRAKAGAADVIAAGAYGHARMREWVLGGTTRELFSRLDRPVLFSH
jgi:nucleotide-binding universal stress UspA family protein